MNYALKEGRRTHLPKNEKKNMDEKTCSNKLWNNDNGTFQNFTKYSTVGVS